MISGPGGGAGGGGGDDVQHTGGQAGFQHDGGEQLGGQRGQVRGLEHHGAAGGDGGGDLAGGHGQREVPRGDQQARAHRLLRHQQPGLAVRGHRVAAERADGFLGEPAQELRTVGDLAAGLGQRLAHLQGHQQREVLGPLGDQLEGPAQDLAALTRRDLRPGLLRGGRGVQGGRAVLGSGVGEAQQDLAGGGILDVERLPGRGRTPLAVDQQTGGNGGQQRALALRGNGGLGSYSHDDSLVSDWGEWDGIQHCPDDHSEALDLLPRYCRILRAVYASAHYAAGGSLCSCTAGGRGRGLRAYRAARTAE